MAMGTPQEIADEWATRIGQASQKIAAGVARVSTAPGAQAAQKRQKWLNNVNDSADKWARNVGAVTLEQWRDKMTNVGIPRIAQGANANKDKMARFMADFLPHLQAGMSRVNAMPDATFEDRVNKAVAMMRHNHDFRRRG